MIDKLTMEDLGAVINNFNKRDKSIIELKLSSGMSNSNIIKMNYRDFFVSFIGYMDLEILKNPNTGFNVNKIDKSIYKGDDLVCVWCLKLLKTDIEYITFSNSETTVSIFNYLIDRKRNVSGFISPDEPLFINEQGKRISPMDISNIFKKLSDQTGKNIRAHHLRKLLVETLEYYGVNPIYLDMMLGHRISPSIAAHYKYDISYLKETYKGFEAYISIENNDKHRNQDSYTQLLKGLFFKRDSHE